MSSKGNNQNPQFDWEEGKEISEANSQAIGNVRAKGFTKLKKAVPADPEVRKKEREEKLLSDQSRPYKVTEPQSDEELIIEESQSGLSEEFENTEAKRLIDTGKKFRGVERFGNKDPKDTDKE